MLSRALILATAAFAWGCLGIFPADAQNLEAGKPPSQIFSSTCSLCHKSARGLLKSVAPGSLPGFLRQHYTTSTDMAAAMSAYVLSNGAANAAPGGGNLTKQGQEAKSGRGLEPADESRGRKPSRPDADGLQGNTPPGETASEAQTERQKAAAERKKAAAERCAARPAECLQQLLEDLVGAVGGPHLLDAQPVPQIGSEGSAQLDGVTVGVTVHARGCRADSGFEIGDELGRGWIRILVGVQPYGDLELGRTVRRELTKIVAKRKVAPAVSLGRRGSVSGHRNRVATASTCAGKSSAPPSATM